MIDQSVFNAYRFLLMWSSSILGNASKLNKSLVPAQNDGESASCIKGFKGPRNHLAAGENHPHLGCARTYGGKYSAIASRKIILPSLFLPTLYDTGMRSASSTSL